MLSNWVALSKMKLNFNKSNVMWFNVKRLATSPPPILLNSVPLSSVQKQKYLGVTFDTNLNWSSHVAGVCRSMSYYLHLINCHVKSLPSDIIKMLVESLVFPVILTPCLYGDRLFSRTPYLVFHVSRTEQCV